MSANELPKMSNPRTYTLIEGWPFGRRRCRAKFWVEGKPGRERVVRVTENKTRTGWNKPKKLTYARRCAIVDGDDGKTYLLCETQLYQSIGVMQGDMKFSAGYINNHDDRFAEFQQLLDSRLESEAPCLKIQDAHGRHGLAHPMSTADNLTARFSFDVTEDMGQEIRDLAKAEKRRLSPILRILIEEAMVARKQKGGAQCTPPTPSP